MFELKAKNFETHLIYPSGALVFSSSRGSTRPGVQVSVFANRADTGNNQQDQHGAAKIDLAHSAVEGGAWAAQDALPHHGAGGSAVTAGGLVFHGGSVGDFLVIDAKMDEELWRFQTGLGADV